MEIEPRYIMVLYEKWRIIPGVSTSSSHSKSSEKKSNLPLIIIKQNPVTVLCPHLSPSNKILPAVSTPRRNMNYHETIILNNPHQQEHETNPPLSTNPIKIRPNYLTKYIKIPHISKNAWNLVPRIPKTQSTPVLRNTCKKKNKTSNQNLIPKIPTRWCPPQIINGL